MQAGACTHTWSSIAHIHDMQSAWARAVIQGDAYVMSSCNWQIVLTSQCFSGAWRTMSRLSPAVAQAS